ncbi:MAG: sterol desaturase family protein [Acidimicrobiales bacterium]|nr:sterol desaturase family protein [Acidimicrobiales bacterium]
MSPSPSGRRRRWATAALVLVVAVGFLAGIGSAGAVVVGFAVLTPLERLFRRHPYAVRRPGLRTDVLHLLFTGALQSAATVVAIVPVALVLWPLRDPREPGLASTWPWWVQALVGLGLFELVGYCYHRASHEIPLLWRFHAVHHSSRQLDWIAAARLHPLEGFFAGLFIAPAFLLLGLGPVQLGAVTVALQIWAILLHANVSWRLRFLDGVIGTPEYHHWHHSNHPEAWDHNYSGLLPVLDRVFGTYYQPEDRRPEVYGIAMPVPDGWLAQLAQPFRRAPRSSRAVGALRATMGDAGG